MITFQTRIWWQVCRNYCSSWCRPRVEAALGIFPLHPIRNHYWEEALCYFTLLNYSFIHIYRKRITNLSTLLMSYYSFHFFLYNFTNPSWWQRRTRCVFPHIHIYLCIFILSMHPFIHLRQRCSTWGWCLCRYICSSISKTNPSEPIRGCHLSSKKLLSQSSQLSQSLLTPALPVRG